MPVGRTTPERLRAVARFAAMVALASAGSGSGGAAAGDAAYGAYLASECVTCHRTDGQDKGIPSIVGWPAEQFVAVLVAYRAKQRTNAVMQTIAGRLADADMAALAAYYAGLTPPARSDQSCTDNGASPLKKPC